MESAVIVSAVRTPVGGFGGQFKDVSAVELGAHAVRAALERVGVSGEAVDEVVLGCVLTAGLGQNPARQVAIAAGDFAGGAGDDDQHGVRFGPQSGGDRVPDDPRGRRRRSSWRGEWRT